MFKQEMWVYKNLTRRKLLESKKRGKKHLFLPKEKIDMCYNKCLFKCYYEVGCH